MGAEPLASVIASTPAPTGTVPGTVPLATFLFTDIEGSTRLWESHPTAMGAALVLHDALLRETVEAHGGSVVKTTGDGMLAVFASPTDAIAAAIASQRALRDATWLETGPLRVRMALHSGSAEARDGDYFGPALNRVARILAIGHGGQILTSAVSAALARDSLGERVELVDLVDLGAHRLRDLDRPEQIFQVVVDDLPRSFPALRSLSTRRSNLPVRLTSFVGRERELGEVMSLVERHRLVTLIGTGGTGKTRLMLEVADRIVDAYPDGAWLAELAPLGNASQIAPEIARALGVPDEPGQPAAATVSLYLAGKELLLLLDNAEHLVDGVAEVTEQLLAAAPQLRILTTSREALAVPGEAVYQVRSLVCPAAPTAGGSMAAAATADPEALATIASTEAVRLFAERAGAVAPGFAIDAANASAVVEICRRLDGIPLAIELAAARVPSMSADDIARRLGDRFRLLAGGRRTAVPRQQTLHALIDWSWDLLTDDDRRLLRRLSIFAGGWTADIAARVVAEPSEPADEVVLLDGLARLVDRSLVVIDRGATTRYHMLETIRQYGREQLIAAGEAVALADRHFHAFAALAAEAEAPLRGAAMGDWLGRLDAEIENLGAALEWGLEAMPWDAVRMCLALMAYWTARVPSSDMERRVMAAIEIARARVASDRTAIALTIAARLLGEAARIWAMAGRADLGLVWGTDALELADKSGDPVARTEALGGLGLSRAFTGGAGPEMVQLFEDAARAAEATGTWWLLAMAASFSGATTYPTDPVAGEALVDRGQEAARRSQSPFVIAAAATAHGRLLGAAHRPDEAVRRFEEGIRRFTEIGDQRFALAARSDLGHALRRSGRLTEAAATYRETLGEWVNYGNRGAVANQLENIAYLAIERGERELAARLFGAAEAIRETATSQMAYDEISEYEAYRERLDAGLSRESARAAWTDGRRLSLPEAIRLGRDVATGLAG